jgi:hypothetical protein
MTDRTTTTTTMTTTRFPEGTMKDTTAQSTVAADNHEAWVICQRLRFDRVLAATRRHVPKWLMAVVVIALAIPGPQDEILVALIIAGWAAFRPAMRADLTEAWRIHDTPED